MIAQASPVAGPLRTDPSKRVNYTLGLVLGVDEFQQDQLYHAAGRRGHNRLLHGYGTVWGLRVRDVSADADRELQVEPGVAVDPCGREICVPDLMCVKLNRWLDRHRAALEPIFPDPAAQPLPLAVVLCHRECATDTVPVPGEPCRSQEDAMQPSRIRESFELKLMLRDDAPWAVSPPSDATGLGVFKLSQPEEQAVRAFGLLLARVQTTTDPALSATGRDDLLAAVLALVDAASEGTLASPPAPNDDPILLPAATAPDILREALRLWVTQVRPAIRALENPGGCGGDADGECCVLLAELDLPVTAAWAVQAGTIAPAEERRPYLLHTRLLQEWLIAGGGEDGRPDVDSWATLQILGPSRVRAWVHHDGWVNLPKEALTFVLNDVPLAPEQILDVPWAGIRNVWDVVIGETMSDGDVVELRFDSELVPLVSPPPEYEEGPRRLRLGDDTGGKVERVTDDRLGGDYRWTPATADPLQPPQSVADELRGPSGEYLDRYGFTLTAFTIYDQIEGGDLIGEYKTPIVAKIQTFPVNDEQPVLHDFLHWKGGRWNPDQMDEWSVDLRDAYPKTRVTGIQTSPVSAATPADKNYLTFVKPSGGPGQWEPQPLPPATGDVSGVYPALKVTGIQGSAVSATATDGQFLRYNQPVPTGPGTWASTTFTPQGGDVTGTYPVFMVTSLRGTTLSGTAPTANQVLAFVGGAWTPTAVATALGPAGGDLAGSYPAPNVTGLRGRGIAAAAPVEGQVLVFRESGSPPGSGQWVPGPAPVTGAAGGDLGGTYPNPTVARLRGRAIAGTAPTDGQVLVYRESSPPGNGQWVPAAQAAGGATGAAGGDLLGSYPNPSVTGLRGRSIATTAPTDGQVLVFRESSPPGNGQWVPAAQAAGGGTTGAAGGDLSGTYPNPGVARLRGRAISPNAPTDGQVLVFQASTSTWIPGARGGPPSGAAGGDLGGSYPDPVVGGLQGRAVVDVQPERQQYLRFNGDAWVPDWAVGAPGGAFEIVAAGRFAVKGTAVQPLGPSYNGLTLAFADPQRAILVLGLKEYTPETHQYVVKGTWEGGVVMLFPGGDKGLMIRLFQLDVSVELGELHLEVSRWPAKDIPSPGTFTRFASDAAGSSPTLAAPTTPTRPAAAKKAATRGRAKR